MKQSYNLYYLFMLNLHVWYREQKRRVCVAFSLGNYVNQDECFTTPIQESFVIQLSFSYNKSIYFPVLN